MDTSDEHLSRSGADRHDTMPVASQPSEAPSELEEPDPSDGDAHATTGGAAAAGAVTGGVIGLSGGPIGAAIGAVGGAIVGAAAERIMHGERDAEEHAAQAEAPPIGLEDEPDQRSLASESGQP